MIRKLRKRKYRVYASFFVFLLILVLVDLLLQRQTHNLLLAYMEKDSGFQAKVLAEQFSNKVTYEFKSLQNAAESVSDLEEAKLSDAFFRDYITDDAYGVDAGILNIYGRAKWGNTYSNETFSGLKQSNHGNNASSYNSQEGLLFSVPVMRQDLVTGVLYKHYTSDVLRQFFGVSCYNGEGKIMILNGNNEIVIPSHVGKARDEAFLSNEVVANTLTKVRRQLQTQDSAGKFVKTADGGYFVFAAAAPDTEYTVAGYAPLKAVSGGITRIEDMVSWVFGLLMVLFIILIIYLFMAEEKAEESDQLRVAKQEADLANRAKSDFLANMSHEIRTPINTVLGMDEMILRETDNPVILEYAHNIQNSGSALLSLINDILDFSKIEAGKLELVPVEYETADMIWDLVSMVRERATKKGLEFKVEIDESVPSRLYGDENRLKQCILNMLTNAVKYTHEGSITLSIQSHMIWARETCLLIHVKDTGIGIRQEEIHKLFAPFERIDEKRNRNIEGTGLGMNITMRLLSMMDSQLEVASDYGKGSDFSFSVIQGIRSNEPIGDFTVRFHEKAREKKEYVETFHAPDAEILVVDDTEMNLEVIKGLLKNTRVGITTCASGYETLELLKERSFDLILMDHRMPGMDGIETFHAMKEQKNRYRVTCPCIILTANAIAGAREEYIREGFTDYLSKPVVGEELENMLKKYLPQEKVQEVSLEESKAKETASSENDEEEKTVEPGDEEFLQGLSELGLDTEEAMKYCGVTELYRQILSIYVGGIFEKKERICNFLETEQYENYIVEVHSLKSSSKTIGLMELSERARELEMAGKKGDHRLLQEKTAGVLEEYESWYERLKPFAVL
ncbi:MAG: response regulator [Lachnospiraceae bacterium]|nr:response regulator [Lachnospiraceae bacterium]